MYFGAGGALGFDTLAAQCVLSLKKQYPHIKLILVLPCITQTKGWSKDDIATYEEIKSQADKVVYTSYDYFRGCMLKVIQDTLGHKDISTTLNIYTDVTKELRQSEFEGLDSYFKSEYNKVSNE